MTPGDREALDRATILLLFATSSPEALRRASDAEAAGQPAYDAPGTLRWTERVCAFSACTTAFAIRRPDVGRRYCSRACRAAALYEGWRARRGWTRRSVARRATLAAVAARRAVA